MTVSKETQLMNTTHTNTELKTYLYSSINRYIYKIEKLLDMTLGGGFLKKLAPLSAVSRNHI